MSNNNALKNEIKKKVKLFGENKLDLKITNKKRKKRYKKNIH